MWYRCIARQTEGKRAKFYTTEAIQNGKSEKSRTMLLVDFFEIEIAVSILIRFLHLPKIRALNFCHLCTMLM